MSIPREVFATLLSPTEIIIILRVMSIAIIVFMRLMLPICPCITFCFSKGDYGWNWGLTLKITENNDTDEENEEKRLPQRAYYRFRLHLRENEFSTLFYAKRLFQQYVVDAFAVCDQTALNWIRYNQSSIRADVYNGVADAVNGEDYDLQEIGQSMILPSSYSGGP